MFLAIDAGNSNVVFALFDQRSGKWTNQFRLETKTPRLISQLSKKKYRSILSSMEFSFRRLKKSALVR